MTETIVHPRPYLTPEMTQFGNGLLVFEGVVIVCAVAAAIVLQIRDARKRDKDTKR